MIAHEVGGEWRPHVPVSPQPCNSTTARPLPPMRTCSAVPFDGMSRAVKLVGNGGTYASPVDDDSAMMVILWSMWRQRVGCGEGGDMRTSSLVAHWRRSNPLGLLPT